MHTRINYLLIVACLVFQTGYVFSQKHDYNYLYTSSSFSSGISLTFNDSIGDLLFEPFVWDGTVSGSPVLSDKNGNFLGFFNSRNLYNSFDSIATNGDSMAVGYFLNYYFQFIPPNQGLGNGSNCAFIPINDSLYYLFYGTAEIALGAPNFAIDFEENGYRLSSYSEGIFLSKIRVRNNRFLYILPEEKHIPIADELLQFASLIFCKHANGEDWWLIAPKALNSMAFRLLIKSNGAIEEFDDINFTDNFWRVRSSADFDISPRGDYFARLIHRTDTIFKDILEFLSFDRCEGTFQLLNIIELPIPEYFTHWADVIFSENGKNLYAALGSQILQFNISENGELISPDTIAIFDGILYNNNRPLFDQMWRLPNGKILVSGNEYTPFLHYILSPNSNGIACDFKQRAIQLPEDELNPGFGVKLGRLPNFPPFRMEKLETPCSSATDEISIPINIKIVPNIVQHRFSIEGDVENVAYIQVFDMLGKTIQANIEKTHNTNFEIRVENPVSGMYVVVLYNNQGIVIHTDRIIKL